MRKRGIVVIEVRKKSKKRIGLLCTAIICCLCLAAGCGTKKEEDKSDKTSETSETSSSLYEEGLLLVSDVYELASDETYIDVMISEDLKEHTNQIAACSYDRVSGVYRVGNAEGIWNLALLSFEMEQGSLSEAAQRSIRNAGAKIANIWIGRMGGVEQLAAASVLMVSSCFVNTSLLQPEVYIYTYEDAYPVWVSFVPGKDGAVSANAQCLYWDGMRGADADAINAAISDMGILFSLELEEVTE